MKFTKESVEVLSHLTEIFDSVHIDNLSQYGVINNVRFELNNATINGVCYNDISYVEYIGYGLLVPNCKEYLLDFIQHTLVTEVESTAEIDFNVHKNYSVNGEVFSLVIEDGGYLLNINDQTYMTYRKFGKAQFNTLYLFNVNYAPVMAHFINYVTEKEL
jgi:hypothetical protein